MTVATIRRGIVWYQPLPQLATQVAGQSDTGSMSKDKGKGHALPGPYINKVPAGILSYEEDPYGYNLAFDNDKFDNEYATKEQHVSMSNMVECIAAILLGTAPAGNSASSSRGGGELAILRPETIAEFRLAMDVMEAAHHKGNN